MGKLLSDVMKRPVAVARRRLQTGAFDSVFGGGVTYGSVNVLSGPPGSGKTSMLLQIADRVVAKPVLFANNEMSDEEVAEYARRIGLEHTSDIILCDGSSTKAVMLAVEAYRPSLLLVDSLDGMVGSAHFREAEDFVRELLKRTVTSILTVSSARNGAASMPRTVQAATGSFYLDKDDVTGRRLFFAEKNRCGPAPVSSYFFVDERGRLIIDPNQENH